MLTSFLLGSIARATFFGKLCFEGTPAAYRLHRLDNNNLRGVPWPCNHPTLTVTNPPIGDDESCLFTEGLIQPLFPWRVCLGGVVDWS